MYDQNNQIHRFFRLYYLLDPYVKNPIIKTFYLYWFLVQFTPENQLKVLNALHTRSLDTSKPLSYLFTSPLPDNILGTSSPFIWKDQTILNSLPSYQKWIAHEGQKELQLYKKYSSVLYEHGICFQRKFVTSSVPIRDMNYIPSFRRTEFLLDELSDDWKYLDLFLELLSSHPLSIDTLTSIEQTIISDVYIDIPTCGFFIVNVDPDQKKVLSYQTIGTNHNAYIMLERQLPSTSQKESFKLLGFTDIYGRIRYVLSRDHHELMKTLIVPSKSISSETNRMKMN